VSRLFVLALTVSAVLVSQAGLAQPVATADATRLLAGVWRAVPGGMYAEDEAGNKTYPFGRNATARIILTSDGFGANTLQASERANCVIGPGPRQCTPAEAEAAFQSASSYQYRYRLEPDVDSPYHGKMIWEVDLSVYPNWKGQTLVRRYTIEPDGHGWTLIAPLPSNPKLGFQMRLERER